MDEDETDEALEEADPGWVCPTKDLNDPIIPEVLLSNYSNMFCPNMKGIPVFFGNLEMWENHDSDFEATPLEHSSVA